MLTNETYWIHLATSTIEIAGTLIIVVGAFGSLAVFLLGLLGRQTPRETLVAGFRSSLGRSILLGLEFLVAADIINTVAGRADHSESAGTGWYRTDPHLPEFFAGSRDRRPLALAEGETHRRQQRSATRGRPSERLTSAAPTLSEATNGVVSTGSAACRRA